MKWATPAADISRTGHFMKTEQKPVRVREPAGLGVVVRAQRKKSGTTLKQAAGLSGVGVRFLLELEHGKKSASLGKALQVAERMGLEIWVVARGHRPAGLE